jgi:hypothetical protein
MNPGATIMPLASMTRFAASGRRRPDCPDPVPGDRDVADERRAGAGIDRAAPDQQVHRSGAGAAPMARMASTIPPRDFAGRGTFAQPLRSAQE